MAIPFYMSMFGFSEYRLQCLHHPFGARLPANRCWQTVQHRATRASAKRKKGQGKSREGEARTGDAAESPEDDAFGDEVKSLQVHRDSSIAVGEEDTTDSQLSRSGKKIGWKILPRDEEDNASMMHATHDTQQEVGWDMHDSRSLVSLLMVQYADSVGCCRCSTLSRKHPMQPQTKKSCPWSAGARCSQHASKPPLCSWHSHFY